VSYATGEGREAHALDVAMEILGGSETSRLYRALVDGARIAVSAGAGADTSGLGGGTVSLYAVPADGVTLEQVEQALDAEIARFLAEGPAEEEVARAKSRLAAQAIYARDSQEALASVFGASLVEGETLDAIVAWPDDIMAVTREEAWDAAKAALALDRSVTGWLLPAEADE
jgi:zinc protease